MQLVIAEKPSVAQAIAGVIGAGDKKDGYMEGGGIRRPLLKHSKYRNKNLKPRDRRNQK